MIGQSTVNERSDEMTLYIMSLFQEIKKIQETSNFN